MAERMRIGLEDASTESVRKLARRIGTFNKKNRFANSTVCVTGSVGVGKSSFIVTVASALTGHLELVAGAGTGTSSFTRDSHDHVLEYEDEYCSWKIRDTPGDFFDELVDARDTRLSPAEIQRKLKNPIAPELLHFNEEEVLKAAYKSQVQKETVAALLEEGTGCVMVLLSARTFGDCTTMENSHWSVHENSTLDLQLKVLKWLHTTLHSHSHISGKGMRVICVLTQTDVLDEEVKQDTANVETSAAVLQMRQCVAQKAGLPLNQVWPSVSLVETAEPSQRAALCYLSLYVMSQALSATKHFTPAPAPARQDSFREDSEVGYDVLADTPSLSRKPAHAS